MIRNLPAIALPILLLALPACERSPQAETHKQSREVMGTFAELTAIAPDKATARAAVEAGYARLDDVNRLMSDYVDDSEIGRLNQLAAGESLAVSPETFECLRRSLEIARLSSGAFDITCRPLVTLWRTAGRDDKLPSEEELVTTRERVGWEKVKLDPAARSVTLLADEMQIDLGGIAKGYALDLAAEAMKKAGAAAGLVNVGGDIVAFGVRDDGGPWHVGVRDPFQPDPTKYGLRLTLENVAVATSGNQQRFQMIAGRRYSHIIDPRTGRPVEQAPSVTVIAPTGIAADAWATVFSVLSPAEGLALAERTLIGRGIEVMWIAGSVDGPVITQTPGFPSYISE